MNKIVILTSITLIATILTSTTAFSPVYAVGSDIVTTNFFSKNVSVLLNNGDGTFGVATNYKVGSGPGFVSVGDFNEDGKDDLAVSNSAFGTNTFSILLGNGDGTFASQIIVTSLFSPTVSAVADYNNDGHQDLLLRTPDGNVLHFGTGTGSFGGLNFVPTTPTAQYVIAGDFNEDGNADYASANRFNITVVLGNGDGTFGAMNTYPLVAFDSRGITASDFNGDGHQDLVTANTGSSTVSVFLGVGDGTFGSATIFATLAEPYSVAVADFDGDGNNDLVTANRNHANFSILLGNGDGTFGSATTFSNSGGSNFVVVADFDGDGNTDIVTNAGVRASVFLGNGDGTFGPEALYAVGNQPTGLAVGNFDVPSDTTPPVVTVSSETAEATVPGGSNVSFIVSATDDTGVTTGPTCDVVSGSVFPIGITTVTCTATDAAGNTGTGIGTITVHDTTTPIITVLGNNPATSECGTSYTDAGSTAFDIVSLDLTASIVTGGLPIDTSTLGSNMVTYDISDAAGNAAAQATRTVDVVDTTAPTITATLVPFGNDDDDEGRFTVHLSASDTCNASPTLTAMLNGVSVINGQLVKLEIDVESESKFKASEVKQCAKAQEQANKKTAKGKPISDEIAWKLLVCQAGGVLQMEGPSFTLTATATDTSGNTGIATSSPTFIAEDDD